jgi:hypothetical protein
MLDPAEDSVTVPIEDSTESLTARTRGKRTRPEFLRDYARILNFMAGASLHEDTRREILYQAIRMYSGHNDYFDHAADTWISAEAEPLCHPNGKARSSRSVIKEHIVPIGVSIESFLREATFTEASLKQLLDKAATVCIVSPGENGKLSGAKLKTRMPDGSSERWARYDHPKVRIRRRPLLESNSWTGGIAETDVG